MTSDFFIDTGMFLYYPMRLWILFKPSVLANFCQHCSSSGEKVPLFCYHREVHCLAFSGTRRRGFSLLLCSDGSYGSTLALQGKGGRKGACYWSSEVKFLTLYLQKWWDILLPSKARRVGLHSALVVWVWVGPKLFLWHLAEVEL